MAETTTKTSANNAPTNGITAAPHNCTVRDCMGICVEGFASSKGTDKNGPAVPYKYTVHFKSQQQIIDLAMNSMKLAVEYKARTGKPIRVSNDASKMHIYADCTEIERLEDLSYEELEKLAQRYKAQLEAAQKAQAVAAKK